MMNRTYIILYTLILTVLISCKVQNHNNSNAYIKHVLNSNEFLEFFRICESKKDTIELYNDTNEDVKYFSFINACNKHIVIKPINFEYDVNSIKISDKGIVLFRYEYLNDKIILGFLNTRNNGILEIEYDKEFQLTILSKGVI